MYSSKLVLMSMLETDQVTPLFSTSYYQYDIIQLLLDHGADPYMGGYGMSATPKDIARSFPRIQEMFMKSNKKTAEK